MVCADFSINRVNNTSQIVSIIVITVMNYHEFQPQNIKILNILATTL